MLPRSWLGQRMQFDRLKRRAFITLVGGAAAWPMTAGAQQAAQVWRIGMLETTGEAVKPADIAAFRQGLSQLGYAEGRNLIIDYRSADGRPERFPALAAELIGRNCDLIVTRGTPAALAAKAVTGTIPVVMAAIGEPLLVVSSLVRPGGNITGFSSFVTDLMRKRVELIKEMVPGLTRVAALLTMNNASHLDQWSEARRRRKL
jgi:putative ABC transport system substrate-binding protein